MFKKSSSENSYSGLEEEEEEEEDYELEFFISGEHSFNLDTYSLAESDVTRRKVSFFHGWCGEI